MGGSDKEQEHRQESILAQQETIMQESLSCAWYNTNMHRYQCMNQVHRTWSPPLQPFQSVLSYNAWKVLKGYPLNSLKVVSWSEAWPKISVEYLLTRGSHQRLELLHFSIAVSDGLSTKKGNVGEKSRRQIWVFPKIMVLPNHPF